MRRLNLDRIYSFLLDHVLDSTPFPQVLKDLYLETKLPMIVFDVSFNLIACHFPRPFYISSWEQLAATGTAPEALVLSNDYFRLEELILKSKRSLIVETAGRAEYRTAFGPVFQNGVLIAYAATMVEDAEEQDVIQLNDCICRTLPLCRGSYLLSMDEMLAEDLLREVPVSDALLPGFRDRHPGPYRIACLEMCRLGEARQNYIFNRFAALERCFVLMDKTQLKILFTQTDSLSYMDILRNTAAHYDCGIGVSEPFDSLLAIGTGLTQARLALRLYRAGGPDSRLFSFSSHYLQILALLMMEQEEICESCLPRTTKIRETHPRTESELLDTLRAYLSNGYSSAAAANALGMHRNTVKYRLELIEKALGESLEDSYVTDALLLELALVEMMQGKAAQE